MPRLVQSPILEESFAIIDGEFGPHALSPMEYAVVRRVIHSTADFEYKHLLTFGPGAIAAGLAALSQGCPILVDVSMVRQGVIGMVQRTFQNPLLTAVAHGAPPAPGRTRTEIGLVRALVQAPEAIVVVGNAPTALLALCDQIEAGVVQPALVIGAPVGFVAVEAAKRRLAQLPVPQIRVEGRKGGSAVAAAILNALLVLAWEQQP
ncbi:MAG TPA: precorrin-8X methylmutase [Leptolyngbyaceae cyanobacterium M65_K2018_010]|nr:precorrin-8X methylmutase [Leptolyngbyaceae cyanobacterium M65_K2018_010]